ncbi:MAG: hypothetical protein NTV68_01850 [Methanomicrobiales archaeon]|nr:hypothetical protein [Methanomicrobiales archaeon]
MENELIERRLLFFSKVCSRGRENERSQTESKFSFMGFVPGEYPWLPQSRHLGAFRALTQISEQQNWGKQH